MQNTKAVILTAVLTTLATNLLLSSWLFWLALFIGVWLYIGYLGNIMDSCFCNEPMNSLVIIGPLNFISSISENRSNGLKRLWKHFFVKPLPKFRSPFVFDSGDKGE